jgi:CBS domain-containing protein
MMAKQGSPALVLDAGNRLVGVVTAADVQRAASLGANGPRPWVGVPR